MVASTRVTFAWTAALIAGAVCGRPAAAAEGGLYLTTSYGDAVNGYERGDLDRSINSALEGRATVDSAESDGLKPTWSAGVGYMFSPNFGIEASYLDLGKVKYRAQGSGDPADIGSFSLDFKTKVRGPALALIWSLPMTELWSVNGRLGAYRAKSSSESLLTTANDPPFPNSDSSSSTSLLAGVGVSLTVWTHVAVRLDYLYINKVEERLLEKDFKVQVVTAGLAYVF